MKKKFTKKYIQSILRTEDRTQIYRLYVQINGRVKDKYMFRYSVALFIAKYAPTKRIARRCDEISSPNSFPKWKSDLCVKRNKFERENPKQIAMNYLRFQMSLPFDSHTKLPIMGKTHLYFASHYYGHRDYNKAQFLSIAGNERFCELICRVGERYFQKLKAEAEG